VIRFRHRPGNRATYKPEDTKLEWWLSGLTTLGVVGMLTPGLFVWNQYVSVPDGADRIEVLGKQWDWGFRLPGKDGKLGTTNVRLISDTNPFGVDPKDPNGQDDLLIEGENLHIPLDRPVKVLLRSIDVLHDFYVPEFRAKMDMVPGAVTYFWFTPIRTGTFDILCFELCGVGHHAMRSQVVVDTPAAYDAWLKKQITFKKSLTAAKIGTEAEKKLVLREGPAESVKTEFTR
ncbi:MAG: cytochrome c oxidase subunit II, partial [Gammaproteobacteria bacterium]